jgi:alkanesulfonate monooxygenase SsuD/methylene tetrahydromethanopterin reductase-like flavin-dependent oxidoreductase (luciferase family)
VPALAVGLLSLGDCLEDPVGGGRPTPAARRRAIVENAVLAERLGFDAVWLAEPPSCDDVLSAPAVVLAAIAARTERVRLGSGETLAADLDPLRVAEDYATLDALSDGRVELVAGRGLVAGIDDENRLRESLLLLQRLWTETEVTWSGRFRSPLDLVTVEPRPVQQPHPPIWAGAGSVELAAELGLPLMLPRALAPPAAFAPLVERYRERAARAGRPARVGASQVVHVGAKGPEARERWRPYSLNFQRFVDRVGLRRDARAAVDPDEPLLGGAALCGAPAEVAEGLLASREALGLDLLLLTFDLGGLPEPAVRESIERFAADALPSLRAA